MTSKWRDIWESRRLNPSLGSRMKQLMAVDGHEALTQQSEEAWSSFVRKVARLVELRPGDSVFEVGCGAGAFLFDLYQMGCRVGGLDYSSALIGYARCLMPNGHFIHADAVQMKAEYTADVVASCGVFHYFPLLDYAGRVLRRMARHARRAVVVLDVPDERKKVEALKLRLAVLGSETYRRRYQGLPHLYYARTWFEEQLSRLGLKSVITYDQHIEGYSQGAFRFNVVAFRSLPRPSLVHGQRVLTRSF